MMGGHGNEAMMGEHRNEAMVGGCGEMFEA